MVLHEPLLGPQNEHTVPLAERYAFFGYLSV